jgi:hypothetical protein
VAAQCKLEVAAWFAGIGGVDPPENSAAFGVGATATRENQLSFGTAASTYTMRGINSAASSVAQSGSVQIVIADPTGNLATAPPPTLVAMGLASAADVAAINARLDDLYRRLIERGMDPHRSAGLLLHGRELADTARRHHRSMRHTRRHHGGQKLRHGHQHTAPCRGGTSRRLSVHTPMSSRPS